MQATGDAPEARSALGQLCDHYWMPVFRFLRREGRSEDDSQELAQDFFTRLLSGSGIDGVDPNKGRFRSYLLGALKHFLAERRRNEGRQKRGGGLIIEAIESGGTETSPGMQLPDPSSGVPDSYFDHQWALAVLDRALSAVQASYQEPPKAKQFELLKPWLVGDSKQLSQSEVAAELDMSTGAIKVAIHRLRKLFREAVQDEIAQTVADPDDVSEELRYLIEVLA